MSKICPMLCGFLSNRKQPDRCVIKSEKSGRVLSLTTNEVRILQKSWFRMEDKRQIVQDLFLYVFETRPELLDIFGVRPGADPNARKPSAIVLITNPRMEGHFDIFLTFWSSVIQMLSDPKQHAKLVDYIRGAGLAHSFIHHVTFEAQYWLVLKSKLLQEIMVRLKAEHGRNTTAISTAWYKLVSFVFAELRHSFNEAKLRRQQRSHSAACQRLHIADKLQSRFRKTFAYRSASDTAEASMSPTDSQIPIMLPSRKASSSLKH